ncbi:dual specificity protein phosphatase family protein [Thermodesulfobacteriota bacterium]
MEHDGLIGNFDMLRFSWHVRDMVAGSAMPGHRGDIVEDLNKFKEEGIELIVSLTYTAFQIPPEFKDYFRVVQIPIVDGYPPDVEQMNEIMDLVRDALSKSRRVVIHCRGGMGRTATVIIPLLMEFENLSLEEAVEEVRKCGRFTQSSEQREFIESWARS